MARFNIGSILIELQAQYPQEPWFLSHLSAEVPDLSPNGGSSWVFSLIFLLPLGGRAQTRRGRRAAITHPDKANKQTKQQEPKPKTLKEETSDAEEQSENRIAVLKSVMLL